MATALKTNCAVETRPGSGSAFKQSLLMRSIEAEDIEYITMAEMDVLVSLPSSSGMLLTPVYGRAGTGLLGQVAPQGVSTYRSSNLSDLNLSYL